MNSNRRFGFDRRDDSAGDSPMYSRLFIVCPKGLNENNFRDAFLNFGDIEEIHLPRGSGGESKGVAYIKFAKTSEAAIALETMNFKCLPGSQRPLKIMVAANRSEVANDDGEKYRRLFISVPKTLTENEIEDEFKQYGHITTIILQKDHKTGESKGFAYILYAKFSQAARAFEECNKKFRAVFARPKAQKRPETPFEYGIDNLVRFSGQVPPLYQQPQTSLKSLMDKPMTRDGYTRVAFMCCPQFNHRQMERFFDLIPNMIECKYFVDHVRNVGRGTVLYSNPQSAAYAVEKLNEFEYPPGMMVYVKPHTGFFGTGDSSTGDSSNDFNEFPMAVSKLRKAITNSSRAPDLAQLVEAVAVASKLIKKATGGGSENRTLDTDSLNYCSVKLPLIQPLANIDSPVVKRCFLVCKPSPPPLTVLRDVFCRFGDLVDVYTLSNKTVGFARYASEQAADEAIRVLHGAEICGVRMKVMQAEEEAPSRKRERFNDDAY